MATQTAFDDIEGAARRLEHLLSQLIALARADEVSPGETFGIAPLDLAEVAASVVAEQVPPGSC